MQNELYEKVAQFQWLLRKKQMRDWAEKGPMADRTHGQGRILAVLKLRDGISTKDLSYLLGVRVSSLNELLSKLEKGGYVTREPFEQDKRVMLVKLTEKGKNEQQPEPLDFSEIFSCLSDEEQENFGEYLDRIISALYASFGDDNEDILEKLELLRTHFGDIAGGAFGGHKHEIPKLWGLAHALHKKFDPDSEHFESYGAHGHHHFHHHGKKQDK